ncbi:hypothetical protein [Roseisalinus antarcticus]|uniref:DUF7282 domain-containing protein n=1 Tax=Roseisalinus antarcticus TaxID=254357 RepID=A0A1Y5RC02_9RHOB|nr:hypothetical protein [Roseisalinus antarcticus]SLN13929.1 hypothetical protein ROA7023_00095 [Roseisalinus antarcticus]
MFNTKIIAAAATATALLGTAAAAESYFTYLDNTPQERDTTLELGSVVSDADGVIVVYEYSDGEYGDTLGSTQVSAGANDNVDVQLDENPYYQVAAVLYLGEPTMPEDGAAMVTVEIDE